MKSISFLKKHGENILTVIVLAGLVLLVFYFVFVGKII